MYVTREQKVTKSKNLFELLLTVFLLPPTSLPDPRADPLAYRVDLEHGPTPTSPPSPGSLPKDIKASFRIKFKETGGLAGKKFPNFSVDVSEWVGWEPLMQA